MCQQFPSRCPHRQLSAIIILWKEGADSQSTRHLFRAEAQNPGSRTAFPDSHHSVQNGSQGAH